MGQNQNEKQCPNCAELIKSQALVCRYCGFDFNQWEAPSKKHPKNSFQSFLGCLGLVVIIVLAMALFLRANTDTEKLQLKIESDTPSEDTTLPETLNTSLDQPYSMSRATEEDLKRQWTLLHAECRGSPSPSPAVCDAWSETADELRRRGICWEYSDWRVTPVEYEWHPCSQARPLKP